MRVVCVQPVRNQAACGKASVRLGIAADDDLPAAGAGVEASHVVIAADARGLVLRVRAGCQRVYVNARAVRERALLHFGDTITLGSARYRVTTDASPPEAPAADATTAADAPLAVRVISGPDSGQALPVASGLRLGAGSRHFVELPFACRLVRSRGGIVFESDAAALVNGWPCRRAALGPGDQLVLGERHLLVEAPALQYATHGAALQSATLPAPAPAHAAGAARHPEAWWRLIVAAAVLAVLIALFLYFRW